MRQDIDKLCTECASLIDNHDKIEDLSAVHYNLGKTLQDVENIVALPQQAAEAEDMLKDDTQLSEVLILTHQRALLLGHGTRVHEGFRLLEAVETPGGCSFRFTGTQAEIGSARGDITPGVIPPRISMEFETGTEMYGGSMHAGV